MLCKQNRIIPLAGQCPAHYLPAFSEGYYSAKRRIMAADGLMEGYAHYSRGEASLLSPAIQQVTARTPHDFRIFANDYRAAFS
jgi:hypothetical protein